MIKDRINSIIWNQFPWLALKLHSVGNNTVLDHKEFMEAYLKMIAEGRTYLSLRDMFNIYYYVSHARNLEGDMAEVGVFQGKGAKFISLFKGDVRLHLFDTFEGMPALNEAKDTCKMDRFDETSLERVQSYLKDYPNIEYYKGYFPDTAFNSSAASRRFSFVHLDADIFQSTLDGLNFFYPRLVEGGVLISHDYSSQSAPGVKAAFDIFCRETGAHPIPLWDTQCLLVKNAKTQI